MSRTSVLERLENAAVYPRYYTARDYFNLPEGAPYQLIEGELIMSPSPLTEHQIISKNLELVIYTHVKKYNLGLALDAPIDVYLNSKNAFQPDIIFISNENKDIIKKHGIDGSPDLVIEILSPSNSYYDVRVKKEVYEKSGVREYLIVDPKTRTIDAYGRTEETKTAGIKNISGAKKTNKSFNSFASVKAENDEKLYIKTIDLKIDLKDIFEGA